MSLSARLSTHLTAILNGLRAGSPLGGRLGLADQVLLGDRLNQLADLGDTGSGKGASMIGMVNAASYWTGADLQDLADEVETQLGGDTSTTYDFTENNACTDDAAVYACLEALDLALGDIYSVSTGEGASLVGIEDASGWQGAVADAEAARVAIETAIGGTDAVTRTPTAAGGVGNIITADADLFTMIDELDQIVDQSLLTTSSPTFASMKLTGDLLVEGGQFQLELEEMRAEANFMWHNFGYTTAVAQPGGIGVNYLPTATTDATTGAGVCTAGVVGVSDPTITTDGAATFSANDLVMISGSANDGENDGIYEVVSHAGNVLTLRSTAEGLTGQTFSFTNGDIVANAGDTGMALTKVTVAVLRAGTDGRWEAMAGADTTATFDDLVLLGDLTTVGVTYNFTEDNVVADNDPIYSAMDKVDIRLGITARDMGSIPSAELILSNQPTDADTIDIGADTYEFIDSGVNLLVTADANIAVLIGGSAAATRANLIAAINATDGDNQHDSCLLTDGVTPAVANGTENLLADEVGNNVRIRYADAPGGSVTPGDPSIVLAEAITHAADIWTVGNVNLNTLAGYAPGMHQEARTSVAVTAAMITNGLDIEFPFTVGGFLVQIRTSAGVIQGTTGTDTFLASGTAVAVVFGGGGAPDIQATDVITIHAWSAPA